MIRKLIETIRQLAIPICIILLIGIGMGCVKETVDSCTEEYLIYISVKDASTGTDITETNVVDSVDLFIFDQDGYFFNHMAFSPHMIKNRIPVSVKTKSTRSLMLSTWGNLKEGQSIPAMPLGCEISKLVIALRTGESGYSTCPDDLFFGWKQINQVLTKPVVSREEVIIYRKNARMTITVKGLPQGANAADYYFLVSEENNGYDLKGNPVHNLIDIKQTGEFLVGNPNFTTPAAFNIIHAAQSDLGITVKFFQDTPGNKASSTLIASVTHDSNGKAILPIAGETTNVLIDLTQGTTVTVFVKITPWDEVFLWENW